MALAFENETVPLAEDKDAVIRVGNTRVTLDTLMASFTNGATPEEIVHQYTTLDLADVYSVIGYCLRHSDEVNEYLRKNKIEAERIRNEIEKKFDPHGIRDRLLARKAAQAK